MQYIYVLQQNTFNKVGVKQKYICIDINVYVCYMKVDVNRFAHNRFLVWSTKNEWTSNLFAEIIMYITLKFLNNSMLNTLSYVYA